MASLDNVLESVSHLPTTRSVKALHRMLHFAVWQNEQLGAALKVNVSEEAYKAALEARPKRAAPGGDHLAEFREKQATVRAEMTAANDGTNPSRVELTAEVNRRRAAGEAPFTAEDAAAYAAKQSGAKPVRSAPNPAAAAPVKSAAKPASKSAVEAAPAPKSAVKPSSAVGKAKAAK